MARKATPPAGKTVEALRHEEATRRNIPTAEYQSVLEKAAQAPVRVAYERRHMGTVALRYLTEQQLQAYRRDGYLAVPSVWRIVR